MKIIRAATVTTPAAASGPAPQKPRNKPWILLVVDDEPDIRSLTRLNLKGFRFADRELEILEAGSAAEAKVILGVRADIAVALIDVVMETDDAGLRLVNHIRETLRNHSLRVVIRTGQPGAAPERYVIDHYDIDDYKDKTELTAQRLYTTVRSALKAYRDLRTIEINRNGLAGILDAAPEIYRISPRSLQEFFNGILTQVIGLCRLDDHSFMSGIGGMIATLDGGELTVQAASDSFPTSERFDELREICTQAVLTDAPPEGMRANGMILPLRGHGQTLGFIYVEPSGGLSQEDRSLLKILAQQSSIALENLQLHRNMMQSHNNAVDMLAEVAEFKDKTTGQHINRMDAYTRMVAMELGIEEEEAVTWGKAARLHDVGKIGIPDGVLSKPGRLDPDEYRTIQRHTEIGAFLLRHDHFFDLAREIAYSHHERWDGGGYPTGRRSGEFHLVTRVVSVVDVFDAMISRRPYKEPWPAEKAVAAIQEGSGSQFDPQVVAAFLRLYQRGEFDQLVLASNDHPATPS